MGAKTRNSVGCGRAQHGRSQLNFWKYVPCYLSAAPPAAPPWPPLSGPTARRGRWWPGYRPTAKASSTDGSDRTGGGGVETAGCAQRLEQQHTVHTEHTAACTYM